MAYIGVSPSNGVRQKHTYTATASQTTFSGAGAEGVSLSYRDSNYVDVYVNGVKLGDADYTATSGTSIVLAVGAAVNDIVEIITYDVFSVADTVSKADGGTFDGNVAMAGTLDVSGDLTVDTSTLHVDSANNRVGVGTASPSDDFEIITSADAKGLTIKNSGNVRPYLNFDSNRTSAGNNLSQINFKWNTTDVARIIAVAGADTTNKDDGHLTFSTASAGSPNEAMRIDNSGNVLLGKTSYSVADDGVVFNGGSNYLASTRNAGQALYLNRRTSDGVIAEFRKDNVPIGSIGVWSSSLLLGTGDVGLAFVDGTPERIQPRKADDQTSADALIDLGHTSNRFKDLYLSGGVYLGGTGSANHLDDYEEGIWTPTLDGSTGNPTGTASATQNVGFYTKVGRMVMASFRVEYTSVSGGSGSFRIAGLPFNVISNSNYRSSGNVSFFRGVTHGGNRLGPHCLQNTDVFGFYKNANATEFDLPINTSDLSSSVTMHGHVMYMTS